MVGGRAEGGRVKSPGSFTTNTFMPISGLSQPPLSSWKVTHLVCGTLHICGQDFSREFFPLPAMQLGEEGARVRRGPESSGVDPPHSQNTLDRGLPPLVPFHGSHP